MYVDCDIVPSADAKDLFREYERKDFVAFSEGAVFNGNNKEISEKLNVSGRMENIIKRRTDKGYIQEESQYLSNEWLENQYFNGGVNYLQAFSLFDQSAMNKMIFELNIPFTQLSYKFNGLFHFYDNEKKSKVISSSYFIHFCGPMKNIYNELVNVYGKEWFNCRLSQQEIMEVVARCAAVI